MAQNPSEIQAHPERDVLLIKTLIVLYLGSFSCEYFKAIFLIQGTTVAKIYLSVIVSLLFCVIWLVTKPSPTASRSISILMILTHIWILIRIIFVSHDTNIFPYFTFINSLNAVLAFVFAATVVSRFRLELFAIKSFVVVATIVACIGLAHTAIKGIPVMGEVSTLTENHMEVGLYMLLASSCSILLFSLNKSSRFAIFNVFAILTFLGISVLSGSRASTIASMIVLGSWAFFQKNTSIRIALFIIIGLLAVGFSQQMADRVAATNTFEMSNGINVDFSTGFRFFIWWGLIQIITSDPLVFFFGLGYEAISARYNELVFFPVYVSAAHNIYLQVWAELGLVGIVLFFGVYVNLFIALVRQPSMVRNVFIPCLIATLATGMVQETFYANSASGNFTALFWFILGVILFLGIRLNESNSHLIPNRE